MNLDLDDYQKDAEKRVQQMNTVDRWAVLFAISFAMAVLIGLIL